MTVINRGVLDGVRRVAAKVRDLAIDGGLPGAPLGYRLRGATMSGPPASGTWQAGDVVPDRAGRIWICIAPGTPGTWAPAGATGTAVSITVTGAVFQPFIQLAAGSSATVYWVCNGAVVATGLTPTISFGSSATRTVLMYAADVNGSNALSQVTVFNIGYTSSYDNSINSPSSSYNWTAQPVSGLAGINAMTRLQLFLADNVTTLTGTLDFTGMSWLTNIECGSTAVQAANLAGCTSLIRLLLESSQVPSVNLGPLTSGVLQEVRMAAQASVAGEVDQLTFMPLAAPLPACWHYCLRQQNVYNMANPATQLPAVNQLWIWSTQQYGLMKPSSSALADVEAHENWYAKADFTGQFPYGTPSGGVNMANNQLTSVTLTNCGGLQFITLNHNPFSQATVDGILAAVDGFGTSGGTLDLSNTAAPSGTGTTHKNNLTGRGWTVSVDASGAPGGGFGSLFTYGESAISRAGPAPVATLSAALVNQVNSGDLLVAAVEAAATPSVNDSAGNTWTVLGPYSTYLYLAYCLSSAASASGITVTAWLGSANLRAVNLSRFVPHGVVSFGAAATSTPGAGGYGQNPSYNLGNLGTVPANALAWGAFVTDNSGVQTYSAMNQSGNAGTPDFVGAAMQGPTGTACILYVPGCANANAALTWSGSGTGASGFAVSAYFTST